MYREKNTTISYSVKCLAPCSGRVVSVNHHENHQEIMFKSGIFDIYQKKTPVAGTITNIIHHDLKNKENPGGVTFEISNLLGKFTMEIFHATSMRPTIDVFIEKGMDVKQGENLCFIEFGSMIRLVVPSNLEIVVQKDSEVLVGVNCLAV